METVELGTIAEIFRGYSAKQEFITDNKDIGRPKYLLNYSDIDRVELETKKSTLLKNVNFDSLAKRYSVDTYDVLLPITFTSNLKAKCLFNAIKDHNDIIIEKIANSLYAQNIVVIRLKQEGLPYKPTTFANFLNTELFNQQLISKAYSKGKTSKGIMINELRKLKIPMPTEELTQALDKYEKEQNKLLEQEKKVKTAENCINNLIKDILS